MAPCQPRRRHRQRRTLRRRHLPFQSRAELDAVRDSDHYTSHIGAVAEYGIPGTARHAHPADDHDGRAPVGPGFTAAHGGHYRWYEPER
ncbi:MULTISPECIES: hypothetical protein [unclassified Streptomyces]|uniref:hypothetical protein n=1 Tax=unclassified Streptomyces TaxID=2593676 RepID=UPI00081EDDB9|nr:MULTISPECIES: hypothetical protein [unclassified Streptomyces]MYZ35148.1 hypothetical protein [Streptomyces sp. SID4917]SCF73069.1 hypothetical protein GA0115259_1016916 [Streptomyces sp. MnatMP-M17]